MTATNPPGGSSNCSLLGIQQRRLRIRRLPLSFDPARLHVVLVRTRNPLNMGAAARAMSNFGFSSLRVVKPFEASFREARSAVGASSVMGNAQEFPSVAEAVAECSLVVGTTEARDRQLEHPLKRLEEASLEIRGHLASGSVALLFGSEKTGLSNRDLSHCHWLLRIPTREDHGSMNLGQAVAVCLYEFIRQSDTTARGSARLASSSQLDRISTYLVDALRISGYMHAGSKSSAEEKIRRLVHRMELQTEDADVWLGMLRQILWKVTNRG
jgi:TrmH family RNA methyltransferase